MYFDIILRNPLSLKLVNSFWYLYVVIELISFFQVVLLTRTDRSGNVRPLVDMGEDPTGGKGKKRRKKKNVPTHGTKGERERYFDDDDKYDLKSMVSVFVKNSRKFLPLVFVS